MSYNIIRQGKEKKNKRKTKEKQNKSLEYFKGGDSDVLFRGHRAADIMFRRSSDLVETELIK